MKIGSIIPIRLLKRRSDGEIVYASSGIPYKDGDQIQRLKHETQVVIRNSIYGNYLFRDLVDRKLEAKKGD